MKIRAEIEKKIKKQRIILEMEDANFCLWNESSLFTLARRIENYNSVGKIKAITATDEE